MLETITINTIGNLIDRGIHLWAHCDGEKDCGARRLVDREALAQRIGRDFNYVNGRLPLKCGTCGARGSSPAIEPRLK